MKRNLFACCALFFLSFHANAQTYLSCDFEEGMPLGFTLIDGDGNTPSPDAQKLGFAVGTPWITLTPNGEKSRVACATSWYSPGGTSDDWLITPAFTVDADNVRLTWRSRSSQRSSKYHESYSVYVSTTAGIAAADFDKSSPLFTTDAEPYEWTSHSVDLSAYKGKTITLAFVEEGTNKAYLYLDDINASVWSNLSAKSSLRSKTYSMEPQYPVITVTNRSESAIDGFTISYDCDGAKQSKQVNKVLNPGDNVDVRLDEPVMFGRHDTKVCKMTVADATTTYQVTDTVVSYGRKVLGEEYTGTWCSWCVRGIVAMNRLHENAKDWFVGIATHGGNDVMYNSYSEAVFGLYSPDGFPSGFVARKYTGVDPMDMESTARIALASENVYSAMEVTTDVPDFNARTINTTTTLYFDKDYDSHKFRIGYILLENNVHHPESGSRYAQNNTAYSIEVGGTGGVMGGWELLPGKVGPEDMWFHEVGLWYDTHINGLNLLPKTIKRDKPIVVNRTLTIPDDVPIDTLRNCDLVVVLLDSADVEDAARAINAEKVQLDANATPLIDVAARWLKLHPAAGIGGPTLQGGDRLTPEAYYSADGRKLDVPQKGLNIVRYSDGSRRKVVNR